MRARKGWTGNHQANLINDHMIEVEFSKQLAACSHARAEHHVAGGEDVSHYPFLPLASLHTTETTDTTQTTDTDRGHRHHRQRPQTQTEAAVATGIAAEAATVMQ